METQGHAALSIDQSIDNVRSLRNDLIKQFLDEKHLELFFAEKYSKPLSKVKIEFIKKELRELLISPVDLVHYSSLITEMRKLSSPHHIKRDHELFYSELETIFKKYCY